MKSLEKGNYKMNPAKDFRQKFPEELSSSRSQVLTKALASRWDRSQIIEEVLSTSEASKELGETYYQYLWERFGQWKL